MYNDVDPPAVAQPTLPPPPVSLAPVSAPTPLSSRLRLFGGAALVALAGVAIGGYALVHSSEIDPSAAAAHAAAALPPSRPADLLSRIDHLVANLPEKEAERACSGVRSVPLVTYASADARLANAAPSSFETTVLPGATPLAQLEQRLPMARHVAVLKTVDVKEPRSSVGPATPGRYEGRLIVVDTTNGALVCQTRVVAWSSSLADQPGVADRALRDDFANRVQTALTESASRMHVELEH